MPLSLELMLILKDSPPSFADANVERVVATESDIWKVMALELISKQ
jgi:hypothetical protein